MHIEKNDIDVDDGLFNFGKYIKNLANIANKMNIIDDYKPKTKTEYDDKKKVVSILNEIKNSILDFYLHRETIFKLIKKYQPQRLDEVFSKYSKHNRSVGKLKIIIMDYVNIQDHSSRKYYCKSKINASKNRKTKTRNWNQTPNILLTRLPVLLAQIKAGNNSYKP